MPIEPMKYTDEINDMVSRCNTTLQEKSSQYARGGNPLHNFEQIAGLLQTNTPDVILSLAVKHLISVVDMVQDIERGVTFDKGIWDEKIGDLINYLLILRVAIEAGGHVSPGHIEVDIDTNQIAISLPIYDPDPEINHNANGGN